MATISLGQTSNNGNVQTQSIDRIYVSKATASDSGTLETGKAWVNHTGTDAATATSNFKLVVYSDTAGEPDALLAVSDESSFFGTPEQQVSATFTGSNRISIVSGTDYWVGICIEDAGVASHAISRANTADLGKIKNAEYTGGPLDPFGTPSFTLNGPYDIYMEFDTEGIPPGGGGGIVSVKSSGTFASSATKVKLGGTFVSKTAKIKVGGSFS